MYVLTYICVTNLKRMKYYWFGGFDNISLLAN